MKEAEDNTRDAATEKHVPVVEKIEGGYRVFVGEDEHPMENGHSIQWIELRTEDEILQKHLKYDQKPEAFFKTDADEVTARAYCNLHGLWKSE